MVWLVAATSIAGCAHDAQKATPPSSSKYVLDLTAEPVVPIEKSGPHAAVDREMVRAQVDKHFPEVSSCYKRAADPTLAGRVVVQFVVEQTGKTTAASVTQSTLHNSEIENCIRDAVATWDFEKPKGGMMIVSFPFDMKTVR